MKKFRMNDYTFTVNDVMEFEPCYPGRWVERRFNGKTKMTLEDLLNLDIYYEDCSWAIEWLFPSEDKKLDEFIKDHALTLKQKRDAYSLDGEELYLFDAFYFTGKEMGML